MEDEEGDIAVVGIGCSFPGGEGLDNFWDVLLEGKNCTVPIPDERFNSTYWFDADNSKPGKTHTIKAALIDGFNELDHRLFGITEAEADQMDPQQKVLLHCTYRALENSGMPMEKASGTRTGVFLGLMNKDYELTTVQNNPGYINHWTGTGKAMSIAANRISYTFNLTGPSLAIDSACSSSLVALHFACQAIKQGDCEMALCGGVSCIIEPQVFVALSKAKMISPEGTSKPFSSRADGYGRGEGCGIILLKPLKQALRDCDHVWGTISRTAVNQDGRTVSPITKPSMVQQEELLRRIYSKSDVANVHYIEAHGTGTPVGDPIEAGSISKVIARIRPPGSETLRIGSVKGNIGHTESAAGVAGLIKVLLMMKHETIVPSVFYSEDSASIDAKALNVKVPTKAEKWRNGGFIQRVAGINNFGFGGTNAHTIVKQYDQSHTKTTRVDRSYEYFLLSAASEKSLTMMVEHTVKQINADKTMHLQSVAYTSACRRSHLKHKYKKAFITSSLADLQNQLKSALNKKITHSKLDQRLVFVFCGNGVTYQGMCKQLLKHELVFREKIREIEVVFQMYQKMCIIERLENESGESDDFSNPDVVQPLLFAIQVGIASLLRHWGIKPDAIIGHSVGEVAAAHCSGLLSLEDAVKVIYFRSTLQTKVTGGKMLVVSNKAVSEVLSLLPSYSNKVCLSAYNSPQSCTLSGDADAIDSLHQKLSSSGESKNLFLHVLDVPAAYHSHMMDPILSQIEDSIGSLLVNDIETELFSTVTGREVEQTDFTSGRYWARNIREPVAFEQAVRSAAKEKNVVFVEIGPRRALQRNILETLGNDTTVISSVQPDKDHETMQTVVSKLFELGVQVDWDQFYRGCETSPTSFPKYQFDCVKKKVIFEAAQKGTLSSHPVLAQTGNDGKTFSCDLSSASVSYLCDHKNNDVAIVPGALYAELGLAAFMASAKPKVPLNTLQLSVKFQSPFLITPNSPQMSVKLDPAENETKFTIQSPTATYASGNITCQQGRLAEEKLISFDSIYKRCTSTMSTEEFYNYLSKRGFQYGSVFRNKGDVHYGEDLMEAISVVKVPEELLPQLHDFCIHPVVLDYLLQLTPVSIANAFMARPGFPAEIGSLTVHEPLQPEMVLYLRAANVADDHCEVSGCFTDKAGRVLVELKHVIIKYLGSQSRVVEEYFLHNDFNVTSVDYQSTYTPKALVFADQLGVSKAMQKHLSSKSKYISHAHAKDLLSSGFKSLLSKCNISDLNSKFEEILFLWSFENVTSCKTEAILENMVSCCEMFRQIVLELKAMKFQNSIRAITYRSAETTVDQISPGFVLSGMTRACAAEMADLSFQLIDISSVSAEDIRALSQVLNSFPCSKHPELVVKDGQILKPYIAHTHTESVDSSKGRVHAMKSEQFILQTADPYRITSLSAIPCDIKEKHIQEKSVEIQLSKICVHSTDVCPVSVNDLNFGQTMYWNKHTSQNHKLLALDFSGIVSAVGKDVSKLKVGDEVVSCYPIAASSMIVIPEAACYNTKRLPYLKEAPCVSYYVLAWKILHRVLPKVKQQRRMGIISSVPDSCLMKVLAQTSNKTGWNAIVLPQLSDQLQNVNKFDAFVLLPPFDKSQFAKACSVSGVKHIVAVCENQCQSFISQNVFRGGNDNVHIQTVQMSSLLEKGSIRAVRPHIYSWLKSMRLDKKSLDFETTTFQRVTSGSIDFLPVEETESYFNSKILPVVVLGNNAAKGTLSDIPLLTKPNQLFQKNSVYIVTGGLTGLGFETVKFIAQRGGRHIVILSRSSPSADLQQEINNIKRQCGGTVVSLQCDVSISEQVVKTIAAIGECFPSYPIKGVFHSAVVLHDGLIETLDKSHYEKVLKPKVNGAVNLHHATKHCKLDYFVCYSSISAFIGNASQTNYCAANSFLDTFCQYRHNLGLAGQSINWGALNLGLLLNKDHFQRFLAAKGMMVMEVAEIHESLEQCLLLNRPQQVICKFSFKNLKRHVLTQNASLNMRLGELVQEGLQKTKLTDARDDQTTLAKSPNEYVRTVLRETIGVENDELNDNSPLSALGIDSMLAMTLQNLIFQDMGVNVPLVKLLDPNSTLSTLVAMLKEGADQEFEHADDLALNLEEDKEVDDNSTVF